MLSTATVGWVDLDDSTDHGRLGNALIGWVNLTVNAMPRLPGRPTARIVVAPPDPAAKGQCLLLPLSDDQVARLVRLLQQDTLVLDSLDTASEVWADPDEPA